MPTLKQALQQAQHTGLDRLDAQILLLHCMERSPHDRAWLISHDQQELTPEQAQTFMELCQRRLQQEPAAYLTGRKEFYGLELHITPAVLDPRPDTETLVDWALECVAKLQNPRILDLGTGSGAIALALKSARPDAQIIAVDTSPAALAIARQNGERLNLPVQWQQGSWFEAIQAISEPTDDSRFDVIVSNPPYLASNDDHLPALVHEPYTALVSQGVNDDGLDDIRHICQTATQYLKPNGWLLLEHGWNQHTTVQAILLDSGFTNSAFRKDLAGHIRCTGAQYRT